MFWMGNKDLRNNNETSNKPAEMSKLSADNHMPQIYQVNDSRFLLTQEMKLPFGTQLFIDKNNTRLFNNTFLQ